MDICELESVCAVNTYGNYEEAAAQLFISSATISKHIIRVEKELGIQLFNRATKKHGVTLTSEGQSVIEDIQRIINTTQRIKQVASYSKDAPKTLQIGFAPLIGTLGEEDIFIDFVRNNPDSMLIRKPSRSGGLAHMLRTNQIDGALITILGDKPLASYPQLAALDTPQFSHVFVDESRELHLGLPIKHPLAKYDILALNQFPYLKNETFIFAAFQEDMPLSIHRHHYMEKLFCMDFNEMNCMFVDMTNRDMALDLVRSGAGILPQACHVREKFEGIRFVPVEGWNQPARLYFFYPTKSHSLLLKNFQSCVQRYIEKRTLKKG